MNKGRRVAGRCILFGISLPLLGLTPGAFGQPQAEAPATIAHLGDLRNRDLDAALQGSLAPATEAAVKWKTDARLHEVHLRLSGGGEIGWEFHFVSEAAGQSLQLFVRGEERRADLDEVRDAESIATLDLSAIVGFGDVITALGEAGVDLAGIAPSEIQAFELGDQGWREPPGFYYMIVRANRQCWIAAGTGEVQDCPLLQD